MNKTLNIIINTVAVIFLIIGLLVGITLLPIKNIYKIYTVMTGSMGETIPTGSVVVVKPQSEYNINDIITYTSSFKNKKNDSITHRIIDKYEQNGKTAFTTKGDANEDPDLEVIYENKIVGKVIFNIAYLGYLVGFIKTPVGLFIVIIVPAFVIIYEEIGKIKEEYKKIKNKNKKNEKK